MPAHIASNSVENIDAMHYPEQRVGIIIAVSLLSWRQEVRNQLLAERLALGARGGPLPKILYEEYIPASNTLENFRNTRNIFHYIPKIRPIVGQYFPNRPYFPEFPGMRNVFLEEEYSEWSIPRLGGKTRCVPVNTISQERVELQTRASKPDS